MRKFLLQKLNSNHYVLKYREDENKTQAVFKIFILALNLELFSNCCVKKVEEKEIGRKGAAFMETVLLFLGLMVVFFGAEYLMRKLLKVEKVDLSETPGGKISNWGRGIILGVALIAIFLFLDDFDDAILWFWIFYFLALGILEAFLEWRYFPDSKSYLVSLLQIPFVIGFLLIAIYLLS